jgi:hypothetical protein
VVEDQLPQAVTKRMMQRATNKDKELQLVLDTPDQLLDATEDAVDDDALEEAPEYQHLPASRSWDQNEIDALWMDWSSPLAATSSASTTSAPTWPERTSRTIWRRSGWGEGSEGPM